MTLGENVVTKLVEAANIEPGSLVVMDNFFSSCSLFENLMKRENYACGTVKKNSKGLPDFMRKDKKTERDMARGEFQFSVKNQTAAVKWMDRKRYVFFLLFTVLEKDQQFFAVNEMAYALKWDVPKL